MSKFSTPAVIEQRAVTSRLHRLTLAAPELARVLRAGHYLLVRCGDEGVGELLLRRTLFPARYDRRAGTCELLVATDDAGLAWLAARPPGATLDLAGPFGKPVELSPRTRTLLLIGQGSGVPALLALAHESVGRGLAVTLLVGALRGEALPPPMLLPSEVELQTASADGSRGATGTALNLVTPDLLQWADQLVAALPPPMLPLLRDAVRAARYRWERSYAQVLIEAALPCGVGACGACLTETRDGLIALCRDGPMIDLKQTV